jgi:hypothetical protein
LGEHFKEGKIELVKDRGEAGEAKAEVMENAMLII